MSKMDERVQAVIFVALVVVAIGGVYGAVQWLQPEAVPEGSVDSVTLDVEGAGWSLRYGPIRTANNTAFGILREASAELGFSVTFVPYEIPKGVFVTSINGSVNGDGGRYWQYWVSGAYGVVAADYHALRDGDAVLWRFSTSQEGG